MTIAAEMSVFEKSFFKQIIQIISMLLIKFDFLFNEVLSSFLCRNVPGFCPKQQFDFK